MTTERGDKNTMNDTELRKLIDDYLTAGDNYREDPTRSYILERRLYDAQKALEQAMTPGQILWYNGRGYIKDFEGNFMVGFHSFVNLNDSKPKPLIDPDDGTWGEDA